MRVRNAVGQGVEVGAGDWEAKLADQRGAFAEWMVQTDAFKALFPGGMPGEQFTDKLFSNAGANACVNKPHLTHLAATVKNLLR